MSCLEGCDCAEDVTPGRGVGKLCIRTQSAIIGQQDRRILCRLLVIQGNRPKTDELRMNQNPEKFNMKTYYLQLLTLGGTLGVMN